MARKQHSLDEVLESLKDKKTDVKVDRTAGIIQVIDSSCSKSTGIVGNGTWGKIDYLCKVHKFRYVFVNNFN
jgi:hypothetical protein